MEGKGMKSIYIYCPDLSGADYRLVLERLGTDSVRNVTVHTDLPRKTTAKDIEALCEVQKEFSRKKRVRFKNIASFNEIPRFTRGLRRVLRKNGFTVDLNSKKEQAPRLVKVVRALGKAGIVHRLTVDERDDQLSVYGYFSSFGLHTNFKDPEYTAESPDHFDKWLYDASARGINTYCDIINMLVMQTHSPNCRHASCFGNTFAVDGELNVYVCHAVKDETTLLGSLREKTSPAELFSCRAVGEILPAVVKKREGCMAGCKFFPYCQGGCPLRSDNDSDCAYYRATVDRIRERLLEVYRDGKVRQVNYVVKNAILNALAFGTAFFD